jgi:hypothetical protein
LLLDSRERLVPRLGINHGDGLATAAGAASNGGPTC